MRRTVATIATVVFVLALIVPAAAATRRSVIARQAASVQLEERVLPERIARRIADVRARMAIRRAALDVCDPPAGANYCVELDWDPCVNRPQAYVTRLEATQTFSRWLMWPVEIRDDGILWHFDPPHPAAPEYEVFHSYARFC